MKYLFIFLIYVFIQTSTSKSPLDKLLVVSYDGFRYDYLDLYKDITPFLNSLKLNSTYAKCLMNVFPTQTFPNHFSLATGMYAGVHGVLGKEVYDKNSGKVLHYGYDLFHYNKDILPIWTFNQKAGKGRHSGVSMWPGSNFPYDNTNITFLTKFDTSEPFENRVSKAISWFLHPKTPANFVMIYFEEPDSHSHAFGPDSPQNKNQIKRVDTLSKYIMDSLKNNNLSDVNVIFLSDHGMEGVTKDRIIDLDAIVGKQANLYGTSPVQFIFPKPGENVMDVFNKLNDAAKSNRHFKVYLQDDIPEHFHIKHCTRAPPILALADPPYAFQDLYAGIEWYIKYMNASDNGTYGVHGYDPNVVNMHPYFIAHGPAFKKNFDAGVLKTVDMFSLFSHVLKLDDHPVKTNGSFSEVQKIFVSSAPKNVIFHAYIIIGFIICILAIYFATACCLNKRISTKVQKEIELTEDVEVQKLLDTTSQV